MHSTPHHAKSSLQLAVGQYQNCIDMVYYDEIERALGHIRRSQAVYENYCC